MALLSTLRAAFLPQFSCSLKNESYQSLIQHFCFDWLGFNWMILCLPRRPDDALKELWNCDDVQCWFYASILISVGIFSFGPFSSEWNSLCYNERVWGFQIVCCCKPSFLTPQMRLDFPFNWYWHIMFISGNLGHHFLTLFFQPQSTRELWSRRHSPPSWTANPRVESPTRLLKPSTRGGPSPQPGNRVANPPPETGHPGPESPTRGLKPAIRGPSRQPATGSVEDRLMVRKRRRRLGEWLAASSDNACAFWSWFAATGAPVLNSG